MSERHTDRMLRVNQAGEYGAARIYAGQLAVLGMDHPESAEIRHMAVQEADHLQRFNALVAKRGVRPTLLQPFWHVAGYALGAATALIGPKAAMACTAAVETEIDRHYSEQLDLLAGQDPEFEGLIEEFREDEREHHDTAIARGAEQAPAYPLLSAAIRLGCRVAIRLSERV